LSLLTLSLFRNYLTAFFVRLVIFETMAVSVKIVNTSNNPLPEYATNGASGMDLRAALSSQVMLQPMERKLISTGLFIELPNDYEAQIRPRSGLAIKQGITCLNTPGTIDADYRGEIKIVLINLSGEQQIINPGDRIAQLVLQKVEKINWEQVSVLTETVRSSGGFGSTGKN
jgi:dUTP pyrophosphatase